MLKDAIDAFKNGRPVLLTDDASRENEADIIFPAQCITAEKINFLLQYTSGIICLSLPEEFCERLALPMMTSHNTSAYQTPFTISIEAATGVTTGVSAADRAHTILTAVNPEAKPIDIHTPGHIFPLRAHPNGVLGRRGHTEGALELAKIAGYPQGAVLCELMNRDGTMSHGEQITAFATTHNIPIISIDELATFCGNANGSLEKTSDTTIHLKTFGAFNAATYEDAQTGESAIVFSTPYGNNPLVRIHSACFTGDLLGSLHCDCQSQLHHSLEKIASEGGLLIYLDQEGRGIGLTNKIKAYALQQQGLDTVTANVALGLPIDNRNYHLAAKVLMQRHVTACRLLTNNPDKLSALNGFGIQVTRAIIESDTNPHNHSYLKTKADKLGHLLEVI